MHPTDDFNFPVDFDIDAFKGRVQAMCIKLRAHEASHRMNNHHIIHPEQPYHEDPEIHGKMRIAHMNQERIKTETVFRAHFHSEALDLEQTMMRILGGERGHDITALRHGSMAGHFPMTEIVMHLESMMRDLAHVYYRKIREARMASAAAAMPQ